MTSEKKKPELLAPARSFDILKTAIRYGADAVYIGGDAYGLRANAENFSDREMEEAVGYAHERGKRVYVTVNIFAHNKDLQGIRSYLKTLDEKIRPDAVLVADPGVFMMAKECLHDIEIHISTQANNTNYETALFWKKLGAKRIVTARELSLKEIEELRENIPDDMEIETFVHGAMCISYSGRCLMSNYLTGRDANQGECTHPCRWKYSLMEEKRPGQYFPVEENDRGTYIMNSKDLNMISHIPDLINAGIDSFKIEGRMKTALYVASVVRAYRKAIDDAIYDMEKYKGNLQWYENEVRQCTYRDFTTGFFYGRPGSGDQIYDSNTYKRGSTYIGTVESADGVAEFVQKNKFSVGDVITIMKSNGENLETVVTSISDEEGSPMESASHASQRLRVGFTVMPEQGDILRIQEA